MIKLLGYVVYLNKQASKVMNQSKIVVKSGKKPVFNTTTELWEFHENIKCGDKSYTKVHNMSKEAILSIEYDYEEEQPKIEKCS